MAMWQRVATLAVEGERRLRAKRPRLWRLTTVSMLILAVLAPLLLPLVVWPIFTASMLIFVLSRWVLQRGGPDALAGFLILAGLALGAAFIVWHAIYLVLVV